MMITLSEAHDDDDDVSSIFYGKGSRVVEGLQNFFHQQIMGAELKVGLIELVAKLL